MNLIFLISFLYFVHSLNLETLFTSTKRESRLISSLLESNLIQLPQYLAFDKNGTLFVSDYSSKRVFSISSDFSEVNVFAGNGGESISIGYGDNAGIGIVRYIAFDSIGNLFAAVQYPSSIIKISSNGYVSVFAGVGSFGYNDGPVSKALFNEPSGIAIDKSDNIYVSDTMNNRIRKISDGIVSTIAGSGSQKLKDGYGTNASLYIPTAIAFDNYENLLITDYYNNAIRSLNITSGYLSTISGFRGVAGFIDGALNIAQFRSPSGIAVDEENNIFVSDTGNNAIRKISIREDKVTTVVGDGYAGFYDGLGNDAKMSYPTGIAFSPTFKDLFIADFFNAAVRKYNFQFNLVTTVLQSSIQGYDDSFGGNAQFSLPNSIKFNEVDESFYISDMFNHAIRKITPDGVVSTYAGFGAVSGYKDGSSREALFNWPTDICIYNGIMYVMDSENSKIREVDSNGTVSTFPDPDGVLLEPMFCDVEKRTASIFVADFYGNCIWKLNIATKSIEKWVGTGARGYQNGDRLSAKLSSPCGICIDSDGLIYFDDAYGILRVVSLDGVVSEFAGKYESARLVDGIGSNAEFYKPQGLACLKNQSLYVADSKNNAIRRVSLDTKNVTTVGGGKGQGSRGGYPIYAWMNSPYGVALDSVADVYIADYQNMGIKKIEFGSGRVRTISGFGAPKYPPNEAFSKRLLNPQGLAIHPKTKQIFVADTENSLIVHYDDGKMKIFAGSGSNGWYDNATNLRDSEFYFPHSITFSDDGSRMIVADTFNHLIREITTTGVKTIAGNAYPGNKIGPGHASAFNMPKDVIFDREGNIYVADTQNHCIKVISTLNNVSLVVGTGRPGFTNGDFKKAQFNQPVGIAFDQNNNLLIADRTNHAIRVFDLKLKILSTIAGTGQPGYQDGKKGIFNLPNSVTTKSDDIIVTDTGNNAIRIIRISSNITTVSTLLISKVGFTDGLFEKAAFNRPSNVKIDSDNNMIILDAGNKALRIIKYQQMTSSPLVYKGDNLVVIYVSVMLAAFAISICFAILIMFLRRRNMIFGKHSISEKLRGFQTRAPLKLESTATLSLSKSGNYYRILVS